MSPPPLRGKLWLSPKKNNQTLGRAVLLLHTSEEFAPLLQEAGFDVLAIEPREQGKSKIKALVEDVQSGVVFLKTSSQTHAAHVAIVGTGIGANGAAHYASTDRQMAFIIDSLALISPLKKVQNNLFETSRRNIVAIPTLLIYNGTAKKNLKKDLLDFLLKKNEQHS